MRAQHPSSAPPAVPPIPLSSPSPAVVIHRIIDVGPSLTKLERRPSLRPPEPPIRYDYDLLPAAFHRDRRERVKAHLAQQHAVGVVYSAPVRNRQNDVDFEYRQSSDLYYLTGTTEPDSVLLLVPSGVELEGRRVTEILFVPPRDPAREVWTGRVMGAERARDMLQVELALDHHRFAAVLKQVLAEADNRPVHELRPTNGTDPASVLHGCLEVMRDHERPSPTSANPLREIVSALRAVKTEPELRLMRRAIDITAEALVRAMRHLRPGVTEYQLEAEVEHVFKRRGAEYPGFPSIVGSGENATILHYVTNRRVMNAGDVVVLDVGAEYHGYTADIARTLPVSGTFSPEQRAIYDLVLAAQKAGIAAARPGQPFRAPHEAANTVLRRGLKNLGLIDSSDELRRFFMHGTSHFLGLDVHDVGDPGGLLQPGHVITVEPGLYIPRVTDIFPDWWDIGVRIEDDVLITAGEPEVLSAAVPKEPEELERIVGRARGGGDSCTADQ